MLEYACIFTKGGALLWTWSLVSGSGLRGNPAGCLDQNLPPGGPLWGEQLHIHAAQRFPIQPQMDHAQCISSSSLHHMLQIVESGNLVALLDA